MTTRICELNSAHVFQQYGPGRPARICPDCRERGLKPPKLPKPIPRREEIQGIDSLPENTEEGRQAEAQETDGRPNRFPGDCFYCGRHVGRMDGIAFRHGPSGNAWKVRHSSCGSTEEIQSRQAEPQTETPDHSLITERDADQSSQSLGALETAMLALIKANMPKIDETTVKGIVDGTLSTFVKDSLPSLIKAAGVERIEITINNRELDLPAVAHKRLPTLLKVLTSQKFDGRYPHVFMPGPAGSGKSTLAEQAAKALGLEFAALSLGPTTQPNKFFGYMDATGRFVETPFYRIYGCFCDEDGGPSCQCGGLFLIDEMDNGHPGLTAELNQALANGMAAFANGMRKMGRNFRAIVTGNTFGTGPDRLFVGRNILDAATLDRFTTMEVDYDEVLETRLAMACATDESAETVTRWVSYVQAVRGRIRDRKLARLATPRASIDGAAMLTNGIPWDEVCEMRLFAGLNAETMEAIK
jgi:hypothetical protein